MAKYRFDSNDALERKFKVLDATHSRWQQAYYNSVNGGGWSAEVQETLQAIRNDWSELVKEVHARAEILRRYVGDNNSRWYYFKMSMPESLFVRILELIEDFPRERPYTILLPRWLSEENALVLQWKEKPQRWVLLDSSFAATGKFAYGVGLNEDGTDVVLFEIEGDPPLEYTSVYRGGA